jgi:23S rRNA pseudouridine2605 synthase
VTGGRVIGERVTATRDAKGPAAKANPTKSFASKARVTQRSEQAPPAVKTSVGPEAARGGEDRIAKYLARAGIASRREAERLIAEGRVRVNGTILDTPAFKVRPGAVILLDGKPIAAPEAPKLWRYHKPRGLVTSHRDELGRPTVFENLPQGLPRVVSVGRLDINSEGLLLLTNDGAIARRLELPSTGWLRKYRVRVYGRPEPDILASLAQGLTIDGIAYGPIEASLDQVRGDNAWLTMGLREGKNREIKRICEALNMTVNRLIRISYGPFSLGQLPEGEADLVPQRILAELFGTNDADEPAKKPRPTLTLGEKSSQQSKPRGKSPPSSPGRPKRPTGPPDERPRPRGRRMP